MFYLIGTYVAFVGGFTLLAAVVAGSIFAIVAISRYSEDPKPEWLNEEQMFKIVSWFMIAIGIGSALGFVASCLRSQATEALVFFALAVSAYFMMRYCQRRSTAGIADNQPVRMRESSRQFNERVRTGQADDDDTWDPFAQQKGDT